MNWIINLIIYQVTWFICVLGGNNLSWIPLLFLGIHIYLSQYKKADVILIISLFIVGILIDGTLKTLGLFSFTSDSFPIPYWLMVVWLVLATLPNHSLAWMKKRLFLSAFFGALGGPLAYWAGVRLGAASFNWPLLQSFITLAVVWALLWPLVMFFSNVLLPQEKQDRP
jgi:hypothetical protein